MKFTWLILVAALVACQSAEEGGANENTTEILQESDSLKEANETLVQESVALSDESPSGWILAERFASDDNLYRFCPTGELSFDNHVGTELKGYWELKDGIVYLNYHTKIKRIGLGEPLPMPEAVPGNYVTEYKEYKYEDESVDEHETLDWEEIRSYLREDSLYPYQIMEWGFECP